jgi:hypothetical protein
VFEFLSVRPRLETTGRADADRGHVGRVADAPPPPRRPANDVLVAALPLGRDRTRSRRREPLASSTMPSVLVPRGYTQ